MPRLPATLVERRAGYIQEAARLCAQGAPKELEEHAQRVFAGVDGEAVDYARTVGYADLPPESQPIWQKALDKLIDSRKPRDD